MWHHGWQTRCQLAAISISIIWCQLFLLTTRPIEGLPVSAGRVLGLDGCIKTHQCWLTIVFQRSPNHGIYTWAPHLTPQSLLCSHPPPRLPMAQCSWASRLSKQPQPSSTACNKLRSSTCRKGAHSDMVLSCIRARPHSHLLWAKANTHAHIHNLPPCWLCLHAWKFTPPCRPTQIHKVHADANRKS